MTFTMILQGFVTLLALTCAAVTLIPLIDSPLFWIRVWDFPRVAIALVAALCVIAALSLRAPVPVVLIAALSLSWQMWRILPYTPVWAHEIAIGDTASETPAIRIMSLNVLKENGDHAGTIALIREEEPDILLLMETDDVWIEALQPVLATYPHVTYARRDDHYGLIFATRFDGEKIDGADAEVFYPAGKDTPAVFASLRDGAGRPFHVIGLHPRPPLPGVSSADRDAQIKRAATHARQTEIPVIAMGDFNDVAWSATSRQFKRIGEYLDPRIGRGLFASFDATRWYLRFPIDQFYVTDGIAMHRLSRGPATGSDHYPMLATVSIR